MILKEACFRYQQSLVTYRKQYSLVGRKSNYKWYDVGEIKEQLSTFEIHFISFGVRHKNLAFCLGQNIVLLKHETFPGISVIDITKTSFSQSTILIMLLYHSLSSSLTTVCNTLENLLWPSYIWFSSWWF